MGFRNLGFGFGSEGFEFAGGGRTLLRSAISLSEITWASSNCFCARVFGVWALAFGLKVLGFALWSQGFGSRVSGSRFRASGSRSRSRVSGARCSVQGVGCRVWGAGCGGQGVGSEFPIVPSYPQCPHAARMWVPDIPPKWDFAGWDGGPAVQFSI